MASLAPVQYCCDMLALGWILALLGCRGGGDDTGSALFPLDQTGPWEIGSWDTTLDTSSDTEVPVQVWYPVPGPTDDPFVYYWEPMPTIAWDAPVGACEEPRPVVVFSHGSGGVRWQSVFLTERIASHGYVVVAPDHVQNTFFDMTGSGAEIALRRPQDVSDTFDWLVEQSATSDSRLSGCVDPDAGYALVGHSFGGYTALATAGATLDVAG
ncbi:MAG: hypothetical protein QGG40_14645, partial [Myxococcota bacterium]|nr:hypothetical protein [Myxococcota bacterium]